MFFTIGKGKEAQSQEPSYVSICQNDKQHHYNFRTCFLLVWYLAKVFGSAGCQNISWTTMTMTEVKDFEIGAGIISEITDIWLNLPGSGTHGSTATIQKKMKTINMFHIRTQTLLYFALDFILFCLCWHLSHIAKKKEVPYQPPTIHQRVPFRSLQGWSNLSHWGGSCRDAFEYPWHASTHCGCVVGNSGTSCWETRGTERPGFLRIVFVAAWLLAAWAFCLVSYELKHFFLGGGGVSSPLTLRLSI